MEFYHNTKGCNIHRWAVQRPAENYLIFKSNCLQRNVGTPLQSHLDSWLYHSASTVYMTETEIATSIAVGYFCSTTSFRRQFLVYTHLLKALQLQGWRTFGLKKCMIFRYTKKISYFYSFPRKSLQQAYMSNNLLLLIWTLLPEEIAISNKVAFYTNYTI